MQDRAYAPLQPLLIAAQNAIAPGERFVLLSLAQRCALHPALEPFRTDPSLPLNHEYIGLDATVAALQSAINASPEPVATVGSAGATLYLPGEKVAAFCRIRTAYLAATSHDRWQPPVAVHSVSPALETSAQKAFHAALHVLIHVCPGDAPPHPAPVYWSADGIVDTVASATAGDSLELPLALAFLSALTGLPIAGDVGATGAIRSPDRVAPVGFVSEKRDAFAARCGTNALFLTPESGATVSEVARKISGVWQDRFATRRTESTFCLLPGVVPTFLYAQIENAASLWDTCAGAFRGALPLYEQLFADAVTRHGGALFASPVGTGETLGAVFAKPPDATRAAIHLLLAVHSAIWDKALGESLAVRAGVNRGDGEPAGTGWRGAGVSQAVQLVHAASAGQILASDSVRTAVPDSASWVSHGSHRLRDLSDSIVIWQVVAPGLPRITVPPESLDTRRHNLPAWNTPLIGRDTEMQSLVLLLQSERVITLTGAGGVGKTRLAIAVAASALLDVQTRNRFPDGAFYVPLDAIKDEAGLTQAVCETVGVGKITDLAAKRLLFVLDNAEGIAAITRMFVRVLTEASDVSVLITSRVALRAHGEKRVTVFPLAVPPPGADSHDLQAAPATALFLERARAASDDFVLPSDTERDALIRLVRRLDGLPLALELAAARTRYLSVSEIESHLSLSLRLLSSRETGIPERQRTLLATLDWSHSLLNDSEKRLLRQVCVFAGGFGVDAARGILGDAPDTLDLLISLEEQSLLFCRRADKGEPPRFHLLQTVADFVREKLVADADEWQGVQKSHAGYFFALSERHGGTATTLSVRETEAFDMLDREMPNLRVAWAYLSAAADTERLALFAANLCDFLRRRGHRNEQDAWIPAALKGASSLAPRFRLLQAQARTLLEAGRTNDAEAVAVSLQTQINEEYLPNEYADVVTLRGNIATSVKRYADAETLYDAADVVYERTQNRRGQGSVANNRALTALRSGDMVRAKQLSETAREWCYLAGDARGEAYAHSNLGLFCSNAGDYAAAKVHYRSELQSCRLRRDTTACALSLFNIGEAMLHTDGAVGLPVLVAGAELLSRLNHAYAESAAAEARKWASETGIGSQAFADQCRAASRQSLAELRETPV